MMLPYRVRRAWRRSLCRLFGHARITRQFNPAGGHCTRCWDKVP